MSRTLPKHPNKYKYQCLDTLTPELPDLEIPSLNEPPTTGESAEQGPIAFDESRENSEPLFEFLGRCGTWKIVEQVDSEHVKVISLAGWATGHCLTIETEISKLRRIA